MASDLFDPLLDLAIAVAKKGKKAKPPIAPPARMVPMLGFAKLPEKAKDAVLEVLDTDEEFRNRVADAGSEKSIGRIGMAYVERPPGWETFVAQMVEAADEPLVTSGGSKKLERQIEVSERARSRAEQERDDAQHLLSISESSLQTLTESNDANVAELKALRAENETLTEQRQRAVTELKRTDEIMARHIAERKRLEGLIETMTAAQLSTTSVGGGVTDHEVRLAVELIEGAMADMQQQVAALKHAATPEQIRTARRVPLPVPHGLFDDSIEYAEYLLSIPNMTVLVDGYNVTKLAHDDWDLERQRDWLEQGLCGIAARAAATFDVVFDGADISDVRTAAGKSGVRIRFSPDGVEADDVIIESVGAIGRERPVTVVSSDNRVRDGVTERGANVLYSKQLVALL